jgi:hypothetical protein
MAERSRTLIEALDGIREAISSSSDGVNYNYPDIANGPVEHVLAFNNDEHIALKGLPDNPHFSSHGVLTDLQHNVIPGSKVETTFPVDPAGIGDAFKWPPTQKPPFDGPPVDNTNTTSNGYSKQAYFFSEGSLVTVGPSLPKIAPLKGGGVQFWVASIGVITQGTGIYEGARGTSVYIGSAYLETWPDTFDEQAQVLAAGFKALVGTYFKLVLKKHVAD